MNYVFHKHSTQIQPESFTSSSWSDGKEMCWFAYQTYSFLSVAVWHNILTYVSRLRRPTQLVHRVLNLLCLIWFRLSSRSPAQIDGSLEKVLEYNFPYSYQKMPNKPHETSLRSVLEMSTLPSANQAIANFIKIQGVSKVFWRCSWEYHWYF